MQTISVIQELMEDKLKNSTLFDVFLKLYKNTND